MIQALVDRLTKIALFGGGWVLLVMLGLSVLTLAVMIERWVYFFQHRDDVDALGDRVIDLLRKGDRRAADQALAQSKSVEASVMRPVLGWLDGGPKAVSETIDAEMARKKRDMERGMTFLGTIGNNAPFIGLLGTVLSVVQAFHALGDSGGQNTGAMGHVMAGIAEALVATGVGLIVALPAVVAYNLAQKKIGEIEANVGIMGKQLLAFLESEEKLHRDMAALHREPSRGSESSGSHHANGQTVADVQ